MQSVYNYDVETHFVEYLSRDKDLQILGHAVPFSDFKCRSWTPYQSFSIAWRSALAHHGMQLEPASKKVPSSSAWCVCKTYARRLKQKVSAGMGTTRRLSARAITCITYDFFDASSHSHRGYSYNLQQ